MRRKRFAFIAGATIAAVGAGVWLAPQVSGFLESRSLISHGESLAGRYCSACHLEPSPEILPKRSWEAALGYMGYWLGMRDISYLADHPRFAQQNVASRSDILAREGVLPRQPAMSESDWAALRYYYVANAPATPLPQRGKPRLRWDLPRFEIERSAYYIPAAVTTMTKIHKESGDIYVGDAVSRILTVLAGDGSIKVTAQRFDPPVTPVDVEFIGSTAYLASIGDLMANFPSSEKPAHVLALDMADGSIAGAEARVVLENLYRLADIEMADLNGDGVPDIIVCGFGAVAGGVSLFESQSDGGYRERVLLPLPGAVKAEIHDFDGDGLLDVMVLMSDAREGLHILRNTGDGRFESHQLLAFHPAYGHTYLELQDFNGDGLMDVLVVNGDNVDSDPYDTPKNYHGVRIYLNRGNLRFEESYFYPMYGAFIAKAADFDQDGDLDIAAIAFYPDYSAERRESFVYLENQGNLRFDAYSDEALNAGRWMTMDVGDIDGDGDVDVVLGAGYAPVGMFAYMDLFEQLSRTGPSLLILRNTAR